MSDQHIQYEHMPPDPPPLPDCPFAGRVFERAQQRGCRHESQNRGLQSYPVPFAICRECPVPISGELPPSPLILPPPVQLERRQDLRPRQQSPASQPQRTSPCTHLGEVTRREQCPTCGGTKLYDIHACAVYGECAATTSSFRLEQQRVFKVLGQKLDATKLGRCDRCPDYQQP